MASRLALALRFALGFFGSALALAFASAFAPPPGSGPGLGFEGQGTSSTRKEKKKLGRHTVCDDRLVAPSQKAAQEKPRFALLLLASRETSSEEGESWLFRHTCLSCLLACLLRVPCLCLLRAGQLRAGQEREECRACRKMLVAKELGLLLVMQASAGLHVARSSPETAKGKRTSVRLCAADAAGLNQSFRQWHLWQPFCDHWARNFCAESPAGGKGSRAK